MTFQKPLRIREVALECGDIGACPNETNATYRNISSRSDAQFMETCFESVQSDFVGD